MNEKEMENIMAEQSEVSAQLEAYIEREWGLHFDADTDGSKLTITIDWSL